MTNLPHLLLQKATAAGHRHWQLPAIGLPRWPRLLWLLQRQRLLLRWGQAGLCVHLCELLAQARHLPLKQLNVLHCLQRLQPILLVPQQHVPLHARRSTHTISVRRVHPNNHPPQAQASAATAPPADMKKAALLRANHEDIAMHAILYAYGKQA